MGINSNSQNTKFRMDSFEHMVERMNTNNFLGYICEMIHTGNRKKIWGLAHSAFFVFDKHRKIVYTGRGVDSPRDVNKMTVNDLDKCIGRINFRKKNSESLTNPIGCNVKWEGKDPIGCLRRHVI